MRTKGPRTFAGIDRSQADRSGADLPSQPIALDEYGTPRFVSNRYVQYLLVFGGIDLDELVSIKGGTVAEYSQLMQLIGYSVSGYGELHGAIEVARFDKEAERLINERESHEKS